jgi:hypothetical protein
MRSADPEEVQASHIFERAIFEHVIMDSNLSVNGSLRMNNDKVEGFSRLQNTSNIPIRPS